MYFFRQNLGVLRIGEDSIKISMPLLHTKFALLSLSTRYSLDLHGSTRKNIQQSGGKELNNVKLTFVYSVYVPVAMHIFRHA